MVQKAREYVAKCEDTEIQQVVGMSAKGTELYKSKIVVKMPSKGGLAFHLKVSRETLYQWARENKEFSDIMEEMSSKQEEYLINKGLSGDYNPTIAKVLLTKHGYREGTDVTTNDKDLPTPILNGISTDNSNQESSEA